MFNQLDSRLRGNDEKLRFFGFITFPTQVAALATTP